MKTSKMTNLFRISQRMNAELMSVYFRCGSVSSSALSKNVVMINDYEAFYGGEDCSTFLYGGMKFSVNAWDTCLSGSHRVVRPVYREKDSYDIKSKRCNKGKKRFVISGIKLRNIIMQWSQFDAYQGELGDGGIVETCFKTWAKREYPRYAASLVLYKKRKDRNYIDPDDLPF